MLQLLTICIAGPLDRKTAMGFCIGSTNNTEIMITSWHGIYSALLTLCDGDSTMKPVDSPYKGPVMRRFDGSFNGILNKF